MPAIPRLLISAAHKSSGKTVFTTGLCAELARRGHDVRPFKKGPDYIDPQWLAAATQHNCYNLDFNTQTPDDITRMFVEKSGGGEIAVIEANKGLHDGVSLDGTDSSAALAKRLDVPVILIVDCEGMTRGIAPLLRGYVDFDPDVRILGVVLNQVGGMRHAGKLVAATEEYTDLDIIGVIPRDERMSLPERHLGLIPGDEHEQADERIEAMRQAVRECVNVDRLTGMAYSADGCADEQAGVPNAPVPGEKLNLDISRDTTFNSEREQVGEHIGDVRRAGGEHADAEAPRTAAHDGEAPDAANREPIAPSLVGTSTPAATSRLNLGIFRDAAFNFYYPDDLEALERVGFKLITVNALRDTDLPDIDALFIGGGFPEIHAAELEANTSLRASVRDAIEDGLPAYAECGGLMYLSRSIEWHGERHEMAGVIQADVAMCERPCGRGYVWVEEAPDMPWPPGDGAHPICAAHEFHYAKLVNLPAEVKTAYRVLRGEGIGGGRDGIVYKNLLASFVHLRAVNSDWAGRFRAAAHN